MLKRFLVISSFFLILLAYSGNEAYGQLITDSDKRLKTQKTKQKGGGFTLFKKKKGRSSSAGPLQQGGKGTSPRYSSGSPFASFNKRKNQSPRSATSERSSIFKNQRYTTPRYSSSGLAGTMSGKRKPVRYSASRPPFTKKDKNITPRYSSGSPFQQSLFAQLFKSKSSLRYSSGSPFTRKQQTASPRYSASSPFTRKQMSVTPRYSAGSPFTKKQKFVTPRYSAGSPFEKNFFQMVFSSKSGPRTSAGMPFSRKQQTVTPRYSAGSPYEKSFLERLFNPTAPVKYSAGSPYTKKQMTVTPRYSAGSPFTKKQMTVSPRYSQGSPYQRGFLAQLFKPQAVSPRYSGGMPFTKKDKMVSPRYSTRSSEEKSMWERIFAKSVQPRYSAGSPYANVSWRWIKPRYSTNKHKFDGDPRVQYQMRPYNEGAGKYRGTIRDKNKFGALVENLWTSSKQGKYDGNKVPRYAPMGDYKSSTFSGNFKRDWINKKDMHPSFHHNKVNNDSEAIRKGYRKWNIFWTRLNRNKVQPDAVTDKISKPKFDRKETEIWNN